MQYRSTGAVRITHAPINKKKKKTIINTKSKDKKRKRVRCGCQATLHEVMKNCTECGYILCRREGEGECFFCGAFVSVSGTIPVVMQDNPDSKNDTNEDDLKKAIELKNRLLKYGEERAKRTQIIDDQGTILYINIRVGIGCNNVLS